MLGDRGVGQSVHGIVHGLWATERLRGRFGGYWGARVMGRGGAFIGRTGVHDIEGKLER